MAAATPSTFRPPSAVHGLRLYGICCACAICESSPSLKTYQTMPSERTVAVTISMQLIMKQPSPTIANTSFAGCASFAPIAAGTA